MKHLAIHSGLVVGSMLAVSAQAGTIGFWRMEESGKVSGDAIVSVANSQGAAGSATPNVSSGAVAPVYSNNVVSSTIYDPITQTNYSNGKSLFVSGSTTATSWTSTLQVANTLGVLDTPNASFTAELFFKETNTSGGGVTQTYYSIPIQRYFNSNGRWNIQMGGPGDYRPWARLNNNVGLPTAQRTVAATGSPTGLNDGGWHHLAFVYNAAENKESIYMDYDYVGSYTLPGGTSFDNTGTAALLFGRLANSTDGANHWYVDEVRYSSGALSASQFLQIPEPASVSLLTVGGMLLMNRRK